MAGNYVWWDLFYKNVGNIEKKTLLWPATAGLGTFCIGGLYPSSAGWIGV